MADYYSVLNKTISGLANNSQDTRTAIYGKARAAIERQLRAMKPVPSEEAIANQMKLLEEAIVNLDTEYAARDTASVAGQQSGLSDSSIARAPQQTQPPQRRQPAQPSLTQPPQAPVSRPVQQTASPDAVASENLAVNKPREQSPPNVNADVAPASQSGQVANEYVNVDPRGMEYDETILAAVPDTRPNNPKNVKLENGRFFSAVLPILLAFGVVGGGLYGLWVNKDVLIDGLMGDNKESTIESTKKTDVEKVSTQTEKNTAQQQSSEDTKKVRIVGNDTTKKNSSKLTPEGNTVEVEPELPKDNIFIEKPIEPNVSTDQNDAQVAANNEGADQKVVELDEDGKPKAVDKQAVNNDLNNVAEKSSNENTELARAVDVTPSVAQKAFLYEEGTTGSSASRDNAAIVWSMEHEVLDDGNGEAVIKGQLDVPGRSLSMILLIKRNRDESLPASHIVELKFQLPKDFSGGNISDVSRFVMKTSEQGRGEGLIAVPAKISDGNFLIALNNLEQALATNNKLMIESSWIDVPLGYTTGRRALVTLEKGAQGDKVFRDAFAEWAKK
ncbi:MAG: hypothetical protein GY761_11250 [Hyphomicrobiales bacterium]|nr:hypothetical protein [Hyphomicrobiales bacterium]